MSRASLMAGLAFSNTRTALAHSISYEMTLRHGLPHGLACSFTLPMVWRLASGADAGRDAMLARVFGGDAAAGPNALDAFLNSVAVGTRFADYGVADAEARAMVSAALDGARGRNFINRSPRIGAILSCNRPAPMRRPGGSLIFTTEDPMQMVVAVAWWIAATLAALPALAAGAGDGNVQPTPAAKSTASRVERDAALAQWSTLTPSQQADLVASARRKNPADLTPIERVAVDDDKARSSAAQKADAKAQADAARKARNKKKQDELAEMEKIGQRN
jgi:hypothetical protein